MTEPLGAWVHEASAAESKLQEKKVLGLTSKGRCTKSPLLPIFSSVCQFYGDNSIK